MLTSRFLHVRHSRHPLSSLWDKKEKKISTVPLESFWDLKNRKLKEIPYFDMVAMDVKNPEKTYNYGVVCFTDARHTIKVVDHFRIVSQFSMPAPWALKVDLFRPSFEIYFITIKYSPIGIPSRYSGQIDSQFNAWHIHILYIQPVYDTSDGDYEAWVEFLPMKEGEKVLSDLEWKKANFGKFPQWSRRKPLFQLIDFLIIFFGLFSLILVIQSIMIFTLNF